jgi:hypothetical protein
LRKFLRRVYRRVGLYGILV